MKTHALALATGLMALAITSPADAASRHDNSRGRQQMQQMQQRQQMRQPQAQQRHQAIRQQAQRQQMQRQQALRQQAIRQQALRQQAQRQQALRQQAQRQQSQAYAQGFRDGNRSSSYRGTSYSYPMQAPVYYSTPPRYSSTSYNNQYWWGQNGRMNCRRQDGTVGTIVGAVAGGMLGNMIAQQGDRQMGTLIGGALGALLGNQVAKGNLSCR